MSVYVAADPMLCQRAEARQITEQPLGPAGKRMLMTREENNGRVGGRSESSPAPLVAPDVRISRIRRSHRLNQRHYA